MALSFMATVSGCSTGDDPEAEVEVCRRAEAAISVGVAGCLTGSGLLGTHKARIFPRSGETIRAHAPAIDQGAATGELVAEARSNRVGFFEVPLPPGRYILCALDACVKIEIGRSGVVRQSLHTSLAGSWYPGDMW